MPKVNNEVLYESLLRTWEKLLPGFGELGIDGYEKEKVVQVVVKAQKIIIRSKSIFDEGWHLDGRNESIVAGGIYFCKVKPDIGIHYMAFKPKTYPDECHKEVCVVPQIDVPVNEHSAIVFGNNIPHKFASYENDSPEDIEIVSLTFFIVDEEKRLETNQLRLDVFYILRKKTKLPKVIIDEILSYVYSYIRPNIAREIRDYRKKLRRNNMGSWDIFEDDNTGYYYVYNNEGYS